MSVNLVETPIIRDGILELRETYPRFASLSPSPFETINRPLYTDPFHGLIKIVIGQQVSVSAAQSVWLKLYDMLGEGFDAEKLQQQSDEDLRGCGLSGRKAEYIAGLARSVACGDFDIAALSDLSDEDVTTRITALKGFGAWSADMFLLFGLGRGNVWPVGDLGVRIGVQAFTQRPERPSDEDMLRLGAEFAPHGSAAALMMWDIAHNLPR